MKKFIGLYWKIEKSKDGLWANYDKCGHKINHVVACQVAKESDIKAFVFILGKYMLIVAKDKMTNKEIDTWWKERAINCSKELEIMDYSVRQYDGDTYNWIIRHKNANGAMSETYLSHKDLVKFTEALKADTLHPKFVERLMAFDQLQKQSKSKPERVREVGVMHLNIPEVKPPMPTAPAQPPQKKDKLEEALKRIESLDAEIKRLRLQEANNILLAWGGVCPSDWAISGDPTQMAEIIRQRGDELQTENLRLKSELIEVTKILKILEDEE